ncbi:MAG: thiamine diphosphokinase [Syntrophomonas sp.]
MKCVIFANGEYEKTEAYHDIVEAADIIICADGGANYARELGVKPDYIIGDLDSISAAVKEYYAAQNVNYQKYPRRKDFTDLHLALTLADKLKASEIVLIGSLGKRLDHTLANIYCGIETAQKGKKIMYYSPSCTVYLVTNYLHLSGAAGDLVSVLVLSDKATGVYERGFEYPLEGVVMESCNPLGVSNVLAVDSGEIGLDSGVLAVFHYRNPK